MFKPGDIVKHGTLDLLIHRRDKQGYFFIVLSEDPYYSRYDSREYYFYENEPMFNSKLVTDIFEDVFQTNPIKKLLTFNKLRIFFRIWIDIAKQRYKNR